MVAVSVGCRGRVGCVIIRIRMIIVEDCWTLRQQSRVIVQEGCASVGLALDSAF